MFWIEPKQKKSIKEHLYVHHRNALACNMIHKDTMFLSNGIFNIFSTNLKPNISIIKICLQFSELEAIYCQTHWMSIATEFSLCSRTFESIQIMHACHEHECSVSSRNEWHNLLRESELFSNQSQGKNMDWHCGSFHR